MTPLKLFGVGERSETAQSRAVKAAWIGLLIVPSVVATGALACVAPFAAVAALAGLTLARREALAAVLALWIGNQAVGFLSLGYPMDANTLGWGLAMGVAALLAVLAAERVRARRDAAGLAIAFAAAFVVNQVAMWAASAILGAGAGFTPDVIAYVAVINAVWFVALAAGHLVLVALAERRARAALAARRTA